METVSDSSASVVADSKIRKFEQFLRLVFRPRSAKAGALIIGALILMVILGILFWPLSPTATGLPNLPPSSAHLFGTDFQGSDIFSEVVWGALPSLGVALYAAFASVMIGFIVGISAGYYDRLGTVLGGTTDMVMAIPTFPLLIVIGLILLASNELIGVVLVVVLWAPVARAVRAQVLSVKKFAFVDSAKTSGLNDRQVIFKVIFFEVAPLAIAYFVSALALNIVLVTSLQFIGMGNALEVTWGSILYWAQQYGFNSGDWWWIVLPGLIITLTTAGFGLLGFSLEEIANPRLRAEH